MDKMNGPRGRPYDIAGLYDLETTIGKGHFAVVKRARHVFTGEKVAVKVIDKTKLDSISKEHLFQEVTCMKLVQHPNVVRLYEVIDTQSKLYLIMELGDGGDMFEYIQKHENGLEESKAQHYFRQIVQAINYCHKLHVVHRDLKPENIVFFEKLGIVKLTDFGFSNLFEPGKTLETSCGSLAYSAPEILLGDTYDAPAVDVWSLGVILFMLVVGTAPFNEANDSETLHMILDCKFIVPRNISTDCRELIERMLVREPSQRLNLDDILSHQWVLGGELAPVQLTPLVSRGHLSEDNHNIILQKMVDGKIATREEIQTALEKDSYNHITATYFLLAERLLKRQQHQGQHGLQLKPGKPQAGLAPLALSPRVQSADSASRLEKHRNSIESLVSPPSAHPNTSLSSAISTTPDQKADLVPRKLSMLQEESVEEEDEDGCGSGALDVSFARVRARLDSRSRDDTSQSEESDHSRSSSLDRQESGNRVAQLTAHARRAQPLRPLKTVRSSPNMLNEIFEEAESDIEGDLQRHFSPPKHAYTDNSPQVMRKMDRVQRKRITPRVTSASSSDASDTDETDPSKKRQKEKDKFKNRFPRRDSSDHSSDTDAGSGSGGFGGGGRSLGSGGRRGSRGRDKDSDRGGDSSRHSAKSKERRQSSGSNSSGSNRSHVLPTIPAVPEPPLDACCLQDGLLDKLGHMSGHSAGCPHDNAHKYMLHEDEQSCHQLLTSPLEILSEENRYKSRVINVRSKNFSDLMTRFKADISDSENEHIGGFKTKDVVGNVKFKRRYRDKNSMGISERNMCGQKCEQCKCGHDLNDRCSKLVDNTNVKTKCCSVV